MVRATCSRRTLLLVLHLTLLLTKLHSLLMVVLESMHHSISLMAVYYLLLVMFYSKDLRLVRMDLLHGFFLTTLQILLTTPLITSSLMDQMLLRLNSETLLAVLHLQLVMTLELPLHLRLESRTSTMILD